MTTHFSQLIYTSTPESGFKLLTSGQVPSLVEQIFVEQVVHQHWNAYDPPDAGYRAVYLHQVDTLHTLFGWLYDDGNDELGRGHVPYFVCYHLVGPLNAVQLESIFMCLHKGPVAVPTRQQLPVKLDPVNAPDLWSYQPARPGVRVGALHRQQGHAALEQGKLIDLLIAHEQPLPAPAIVGSSQSRTVRLAPLFALPELHTLRRAVTILDDPPSKDQSRSRLLLIAVVVALLLPFGLAALFGLYSRQTQQKLEVVNQKVTSAEAQIRAVGSSGVQKIEKVEQRLGRTEQQLGTVVRRLDRTEGKLQKVDRTDRQLQKVVRRLNSTESRLNTAERSVRGVVASKSRERVSGSKNRTAPIRVARSAPRRYSLARRQPSTVSPRLQTSPELSRGLSPSPELARYTRLKEQQAQADSTRMFGLYRKNRKS